jgi:hypothetical protein
MQPVLLKDRLFADLDNEQFVENIVGITKHDSDEMMTFDGIIHKVVEGDYIYIFMEAGFEGGKMSYVVAEGLVMKNNLNITTHKWICKLTFPSEWLEDYDAKVLDKRRNN